MKETLSYRSVHSGARISVAMIIGLPLFPNVLHFPVDNASNRDAFATALRPLILWLSVFVAQLAFFVTLLDFYPLLNSERFVDAFQFFASIIQIGLPLFANLHEQL